MKEKINRRLEEIGSSVRVIKILSNQGEEIVRRRQKFDHAILSTGLMFTSLTEYQKFCRRVNSNRSSIFCFEELYNCDEGVRLEAEKKLRSSNASKNSFKGWLNISKEKRHQISSNRAKKAWSEGKMCIPCKGWNKGLTKDTCNSVKVMANSRLGRDNPMSREKVNQWSSLKRKAYYDKLSRSMKLAIEEGRFTPNVHNSNTYWIASYKEKQYRSSLESAIAAILDESFIFEDTRIRYHDGEKERIYIVDFTSHQHKMMIEVKPKSMIDASVEKINAGRKYAEEIGYQFVILDEEFLRQHADKIKQSKNDFSPNTWAKVEKYLEANI